MLKSLCLAVSMAIGLQAQENHHWYYYTVDTAQIKGYSEIAFDGKGDIKVAYRRTYELWYGELEGHRFKIQKADTGAGADSKLAFALDKSGRPHILYQDAMYQSLYMASFDGQRWNHRLFDRQRLSTVDFYHMDLVADDEGGLHAIYTKNLEGHNTLFYSHVDKDGKAGDSAFVNPVPLNGKWNSMTLDSQGRPVMAFFRHTGEVIQVAYPDSGTRKIQIVGADWPKQPQGFYVSIKRDTGETYYMAYRYRPAKELRLLRGRPGGAWTDELVDSSLSTTLFNSPSVLGMGKGGVPFVAYPRIASEDGAKADTCRLLLAYKKDNAWIREVVDSAGIVGEFISMAMSPEGLPAISYLDRTNRRLRVAVARTVAPTDTNGNSIPDYQEVPVSIRQKFKPKLGRGSGLNPGKAYDSRGKAADPAKKSPAGVWFRPETSPDGEGASKTVVTDK